MERKVTHQELYDKWISDHWNYFGTLAFVSSPVRMDVVTEIEYFNLFQFLRWYMKIAHLKSPVELCLLVLLFGQAQHVLYSTTVVQILYAIEILWEKWVLFTKFSCYKLCISIFGVGANMLSMNICWFAKELPWEDMCDCFALTSTVSGYSQPLKFHENLLPGMMNIPLEPSKSLARAFNSFTLSNEMALWITNI